MNDVRVCNMKYLGWAYKNVPWFKEQIDSDKKFFAMVREHELLPPWHKEHVSRHWRKYTGRGADRVHDECHDTAMFSDT